MSRIVDRLIHADALRRQRLGHQAARFKRQSCIMFASIALGAVGAPYMLLPTTNLQAAGYYYAAKTKLWFTAGMTPDTSIRVSIEGRAFDASAHALVAHPLYRQAAKATVGLAARGGGLGLFLWLAALLLVREAAARRRERALRERLIAGTELVSEKELARLTATDADRWALSLGTVSIPNRIETRHMAMVGTTGSGKTTALRQLLDGIEARGEAALVYDTSGEFVAHYYNPKRGDIILNPFDARCAYWSPFAEIAHPADADRIAHQLITETGQHDRDVWLETSRILVANMIRALWREGKCTLPDLLGALQDRSKDELKAWLAGSSSARTFAEDADRATGSVLFMLAKAANLIQFLQVKEAEESAFAFRDFIAGLDACDGPRPWIFVPRKEDYFEASKPLLACWLECAASAVLGLSPSAGRRIWFILDELADLPRVDNLARLLPEGRKFGAAVVLTFQAVGQMRHRYGPEIAESLLGCCNAKLFLQTIDGETRRWASETIGTCDVEIPTMTHAHDDEDGRRRTTLATLRETRPAVLESELRLPKYEGYLLFPDAMPVARIRLTAGHIARRGKARQPGFIAGDPKRSLWQQTSAPATLAAPDAPVTPVAPAAPGKPKAPPRPKPPARRGPV